MSLFLLKMEGIQMLSVRALNWLKSVGYAGMTHEERMTLIAAAKIAYPDDDEEFARLFMDSAK